ncbi:MAG: 50S ribosomal protein L6 [Thermoprotei archaeon]|nr:MAG: 50S ribosomal protein L6 [Thermoprotei archaeon]
MRVVRYEERVKIPENVKVNIDGKRVTVEGPLGKITKDFSHAKVNIRKEEGEIVVETFFARKKEYAVVKTIASRINNMIIGVTRGFRYKMKVVYAHFPMSITVNNEKRLIIIENFLGRKEKRYAKIVGDVKVTVQKDDVIVEGIDIDSVSQTCANIHLATHLTGEERLCPHGREGGPGVLDGIYLYAKEHIK